MWRCNYTSSYIKVDLCARTDSKNGIFTRRVLSACIFDSYPLPLFRRFIVGAAIEKNFFWFYFSDFVLEFYFFQNPKVGLIISIRSTFFICFVLYSSRFDFSISDIELRFWFSTRINFDLFQHCRLYALTLQLFISLTFLLVINKHLCLYEFVLCLFWLF